MPDERYVTDVLVVLFYSSNPFSGVLHKEYYSLSVSNMINFNEVDSSECCSKEVVSFVWRSVYLEEIRNRTHSELILNDCISFYW